MDSKECPYCSAPVRPSFRVCEYCRSEYFITSVAYFGALAESAIGAHLQMYNDIVRRDPDSPEANLGLGILHLHQGVVTLALGRFEKVIQRSPEAWQAYYYWSLAKVGGRRLMTLSLKEVQQVETYLNAALQLSPDAVTCRLFLALLKEDYYETNGMRCDPPAASELLAAIEGKEVNSTEFQMLCRYARVGETAALEMVVPV